MQKRNVLILVLIAQAILGFLLPVSAERRGEVYRLRREYNYATRRLYPELSSQLNAAPFVHTLPVQLLIDKPEQGRLHASEFDALLTEGIMRHALNPPALPPSEEILAPGWTRLAWKVEHAMEWAHVLHEQLIDILADDRVQNKKAAIDEAVADYLKDPVAITAQPLKVEVLSMFPYSHEFHHAYPGVMGIMMSYHWLQGKQYDAMLTPLPERRAAVAETVQQFRGLLNDTPIRFPLTHVAAPKFHEIAPEAGYIFDNLHILHHIAQDILITEKIKDKRKELYRVLPLFLNRTAPENLFAAGPQEEPLMPGALGHGKHVTVHQH